jgi:hypothetical protein
MLSSKLIRLVSTHREEIAARVIRRIRRESRLLELGKMPEGELRDRALEVFEHLGTWLIANRSELAQTDEKRGRRLHEEGVPLHEAVHALQIIKECMIQFAQDERMTGNTLEMYAEEELEHTSDRLFDLMIYNLVRGYESAMWERVVSAP